MWRRQYKVLGLINDVFCIEGQGCAAGVLCHHFLTPEVIFNETLKNESSMDAGAYE
jgi:hypothetical protein